MKPLTLGMRLRIHSAKDDCLFCIASLSNGRSRPTRDGPQWLTSAAGVVPGAVLAAALR